MRRILTRLVVLAAAVVAAPSGGAENQCEACHSDPRFLSRNPVIYEYFQDWLISPHKSAGVTCEQCHGGDPTTTDKAKAHRGVLPAGDPRSRVNYLNQPRTCGACHADVVEQAMQSAHFKAQSGERPAPSCATCHRAMNKKPFFGSIIETQCRACHARQGDPVPAEKVDLAREILHRLHVAKAYLGWTRVYFESQGWPEDSRERVKDLREDYHRVVLLGHGLDMDATSEASLELLGRLKAVFSDAWDEHLVPPGAPPP